VTSWVAVQGFLTRLPTRMRVSSNKSTAQYHAVSLLGAMRDNIEQSTNPNQVRPESADQDRVGSVL
jgi:hypothetical protein